MFVRAAISGVVREAVIAALLTALMILLFLGSWRSTLMIAISIPLSILASIVCLSALGETINIMTLGGLALAVGILVDDATVTIENINRHLERGEDVEKAILNGAHEIALPALVSTLAICIVFVPMFLLAGIARFLFIPLAEAVVFAMLASYLLSRTLVPTLAKYWLQQHARSSGRAPGNALVRLQERFERGFAADARALHTAPHAVRSARARFALPFLAAMAATALWPSPWAASCRDSGRTSFRASTPARSSCTCARAPDCASRRPRRCATGGGDHPPRDSGARDRHHRRQHRRALQRHQSGLLDLGAGRPGRCRHLREFAPEHHRPTTTCDTLRAQLPHPLPLDDLRLPAGGHGQPDPELRPALTARRADRRASMSTATAATPTSCWRACAGSRAVRSAHPAGLRLPALNVDVDRSKAALLGLTEQDVASNLLVSLSGSFQTGPRSGSTRRAARSTIAAQTPQFRLASLTDLGTTPITGGRRGIPAAALAPGGSSQLLANLATIHRSDHRR